MVTFNDLKNDFLSGDGDVLWAWVLGIAKSLPLGSGDIYTPQFHNRGTDWDEDSPSEIAAEAYASYFLSSKNEDGTPKKEANQFERMFIEYESLEDLRRTVRFYLKRTLKDREDTTVIEQLLRNIRNDAKEGGWQRRMDESLDPFLNESQIIQLVNSLLDIPRLPLEGTAREKGDGTIEYVASRIYKKKHRQELTRRVRELHPNVVQKDFRNILKKILPLCNSSTLGNVEEDYPNLTKPYDERSISEDDRVTEKEFYAEARAFIDQWHEVELKIVWLKMHQRSAEKIKEEIGESPYKQAHIFESQIQKIRDFAGSHEDSEIRAKAIFRAISSDGRILNDDA